jgi:hypothetical protein
MDGIEYLERKAEGSATLARLGPDAFQFIGKQYCQRTGKELGPEITILNAGHTKKLLADAEARLAKAQAEVDGLRALLGDLQGLEADARSATSQR